MSDWDYIVVGAGSAGCVLANRLSADPFNRVLLLEAGSADRGARYKIVALSATEAIGNPSSDWMMRTEPDPSRMNRIDSMPRGKALGGSSSINGTIYVRGNRGDYDHWAQLGCVGWDYDSLLKVFHRMEGAAADVRREGVYGETGPLTISRTRGPHPLARVFIDAIAELGAAENARYNREARAGASITHVTQRGGWRWSSADAYLRPAMHRANLRVITGALVRRIVFDGKRAAGVEYDQDGQSVTARCNGEVILSASAYNSPKLLMLSGVGDPEHLARHGIATIRANPHVGRNLQEHPACMVKAYVRSRTSNMDGSGLGKLRQSLRFAFFRSGPATHVWPAIAFMKVRAEAEYPDLMFHFGAFVGDVTPDGFKLSDRPGITVLPAVNRSRSRGYVALRSSDPLDSPVIQHNMLGDPHDLEVLVAGVRHARSILHTRAFASEFKAEHVPGPGVVSDADLEHFVRATSTPGYHPCGTVKMGTDAAAVVNPRLRVIGVEGLGVIDSSIIPQIPSGNINAISLLIGEMGADALLADQPWKQSIKRKD